MSFLRSLGLTCLAFSLRGLRPVAATEPLCRFLTAARWLDKKTNRIKLQAFKLRDTESGLSVYRTQGVAMSRVWRIGRLLASGTREGVLHGRADLRARDVLDMNLGLRRGPIPSLHVDVT